MKQNRKATLVARGHGSRGIETAVTLLIDTATPPLDSLINP
jgi:hypothetical protein